MKKNFIRFCVMTLILSFTVSCQPRYIVVPLPGGDEEGAGPSVIFEEKEVVGNLLETFNPGQALADSNGGRTDIWNEYIKDSVGAKVRVAIFAVNSKAVSSGSYIIRVHFDGYNQNGSMVTIEDGYMDFTFNVSDSTSTTEFSISTPIGLKIKTDYGQVVEEVKIESGATVTDAVTISSDEEGKITIEVDSTKPMELPPSAAASSSQMNEAIIKAETENEGTATDNPDFVADSFSINEIIYYLDNFDRKSELPEGMQILLNDIFQGGTSATIQLDNTRIGNVIVTGCINFEFEKDRTNLVSFVASVPNVILVKPDGSLNWNRVSFESLEGISNIDKGDSYLNVKYALQIGSTDLYINGNKISYQDIKGSGTASDPYLISTGSDMRSIADYYKGANIDTTDIYLMLDDDIDVSGLFTASLFGDFRGTLDGNGYTITGLESSFATNAYGTVKNLKLADVSYPALVGNLYGVIDTVEILNGEINESNQDAAGFALIAGKSAEIKNVINRATVQGKHAGGIVAAIKNAETFKLSNAANYGNVTASSDAGGIIGIVESFSDSITVENVLNSGNITENFDAAGGIIGCISGSGNAAITHAENRGNITGAYYAGGIVGVGYTPITLVGIQNTGNISANENYAGGIAGYLNSSTCEIIGALNNGTVSGAETLAGIANTTRDSVKITSAISTGTISGYGISSYNKTNMDCTACFYSNAEKGIGNDSITGVEKIEDSTSLSEVVSAMNQAIKEAGKDLEFTYLDENISLPGVNVEITIPSV